MTEISLFRLYILRATYLLITVGLTLTIWPRIINHSPDWPLMNSVVACMLGAVALLAALGIRYPLQMLPVLLFELVWKTIWLVAVALPLSWSGQIDARTADTVRDCLWGAILLVAIPWRYVFDQYVRQPSNPWRAKAGMAAATQS